MPDIFISYAREDEKKVGQLVSSLETRSWSVFWDRAIPPGKTWRQIIGEKLDTAACVIVVWSKSSVKSGWVIEEAEVAQGRGVLVPILFDAVKPPLGFGGIQAADFSSWDGERHSNQFQRLSAAISNLIDVAKLDRDQIKPDSEIVANKIEVDLSDLLGVHTVHEYCYKEEEHFQEFLNQIYVKYLVHAGTVAANTYDSYWRFIDKETGKPLRKSATMRVAGQAYDGRYMKEVGVMPGMTLRAIRIKKE